MRRLPRPEQRALIGMDLRHRRNPSAALWMQIQKMREESKEESREDGNDRSDPWPPGGPQPTRAAPFAKLPPPPPPPPAKPPAKAKENGPVALSQAVKLESLEQGKPNHEPKEGGAVAFVLFRHGGGASVPEFVEVLDHLHALTCGRASSSDILIKVQHASKKHAEFRVEHGPNGEALLMFCDLSSNGTWLNGDRLPSGRLTRLLSGDIIFFMPPGSSDDVPALQVEEQQTKSQEPDSCFLKTTMSPYRLRDLGIVWEVLYMQSLLSPSAGGEPCCSLQTGSAPIPARSTAAVGHTRPNWARPLVQTCTNESSEPGSVSVSSHASSRKAMAAMNRQYPTTAISLGFCALKKGVRLTGIWDLGCRSVLSQCLSLPAFR